MRVSAEVPGDQLSVRMTLYTRIILAGRQDDASFPVVGAAGAILWQDQQLIALEGTAGRFPTRFVDFRDVGIAPNDAAWLLVWNGDMDVPVLGGVEVLINRAHPTMVRVVSPAPDDELPDYVMSALYHDLGRSLISAALKDEQFISEETSYEYGTIGAAIRRLIHMMFPGENTESLKAQMDERPRHFEARLQDKLRLYQQDQRP